MSKMDRPKETNTVSSTDLIESGPQTENATHGINRYFILTGICYSH